MGILKNFSQSLPSSTDLWFGHRRREKNRRSRFCTSFSNIYYLVYSIFRCLILDNQFWLPIISTYIGVLHICMVSDEKLKWNIVSFLVSIPFISTMIFSISGGSIAEWIGRKRTLIIGQICMMSGWIVLYFARKFQIAIIGRFIIG